MSQTPTQPAAENLPTTKPSSDAAVIQSKEQVIQNIILNHYEACEQPSEPVDTNMVFSIIEPLISSIEIIDVENCLILMGIKTCNSLGMASWCLERKSN